jgi:ubiquinone/menaquinone biosynthesis C-methylase UbiE
MRPGGLGLTKQLLGLRPLAPGSRALDLGCGEGQTLEYLNGQGGVEAWGLDLEGPRGERILRGRAEALPFEDASFDAVIFECSLSVIADPDAALREAARVLKKGGAAYLGDLYLPEGAPEFSGLPWRLDRRETLAARFAAAGFRVCCFEDRSGELRSWWAAQLFANTAEELPSLPRGFKGGYYLALAERLL